MFGRGKRYQFVRYRYRWADLNASIMVPARTPSTSDNPQARILLSDGFEVFPQRPFVDAVLAEFLPVDMHNRDVMAVKVERLLILRIGYVDALEREVIS